MLADIFAKVETLREFVLRTQRTTVAVSLQSAAVEGDSGLLYLLDRCLVAHDKVDLPMASDPDATVAVHCSSQRDVVRQAIERVFSSTSAAHPDNVLAFGHCRPRFGGTSAAIFHGVCPCCLSFKHSELMAVPDVG